MQQDNVALCDAPDHTAAGASQPVTRPKAIPEHERIAIAAEVVQLLSQVDELGRRRWTTVSLGQACGGLRHETIRLARSSAGVGPSVRDAILSLTGTTMDQLLQRHAFDAGTNSRTRLSTLGAYTPSPNSTISSPNLNRSGLSASQSSALPVPDRIALGRQVIVALQADGFDRVKAQHAVSDVLFSEEVTDILELYRKSRAALLAAQEAEEAPKAQGSRANSKQSKTVTKKR